MEIIDHRLVGALRVDLFARGGARDEADGTAVFQTASIEALLDGAYEGDLTIAELLVHGDLGVGTIDHLDGELIVVDGVAHVARADGSVRAVPGDVITPFAAVCRFRPGPELPLGPCADLDVITATIDEVAPGPPVLAVRIDGHFPRLLVRSVARQEPPYPPLREVVAHQREQELADVDGTLVGFRFPDTTGGFEVPGWHLHAVDDARRVGGHVMDASLASGILRYEATDELHVEIPASVGAPSPGHTDRREEIATVERARPSPAPNGGSG